MDPQFVVMLAVFLVVLVAFVVGGRFLVPLIAQHFKGSAGGWRRFSKLYATTRQLPAQLFRRQNIVMGQVLYRNCMTVAFDDVGLYLEPGFPVSFLGRLFIPWTEFKRVEEGRLFWRRAAVLTFGKPPGGTITMPMELFNTIRSGSGEAAKRMPGDLR